MFSAQRIKELNWELAGYDYLRKRWTENKCIVFVIYGAQYEVLTSTHCKNNYIGDLGLTYTVWIIDFLQPNTVYVIDFPETAFVDEKVRVF